MMTPKQIKLLIAVAETLATNAHNAIISTTLLRLVVDVEDEQKALADKLVAPGGVGEMTPRERALLIRLAHLIANDENEIIRRSLINDLEAIEEEANTAAKLDEAASEDCQRAMRQRQDVERRLQLVEDISHVIRRISGRLSSASE